MWPKRAITRTLLIMKFTTLLLITVSLQVAASSYAQKITLSEKDAPIKKIFEQIRTQSGYDFLFTTSIIKSAVPVNINVRETDLSKVLEMIFAAQPLEYTMEKKSVIVSRKEPSVLARINGFFTAIEINGRILDEKGNPISSANIRIKGSDKGVKSAADGRFTIAVPNDQTVLVISYIGFLPKEVIAKENMTVTMEALVNELNDMVVVGYGTTRRKDLTGSIASVNVAEVKNVPFATIDQALTGKAAGVQVIQADGSPGGVAKIRIRGGTSLLGGNDPLYIIDGVQMQIQNRYVKSAAEIVSPVENFGGTSGAGIIDAANTISGAFSRGLNSLGGLNINDIETIDILKDASATAIYGSRAANGVVIITTKKGKQNQKPVFELNYYTGISKPIKEKLLNRDQYIGIVKEAAKNLNDEILKLNDPSVYPLNPVATKILSDPGYFGASDTDWLGLVLRNSITQNGDISVRGGGAGSGFYSSLSYNKNKGVVAGTDFSRVAGKISLDNEISSKLRINTNLDYGFTTNNITNGAYTQALFAPPTVAPYHTDGSVRIISDDESGSYFGVEGFQNPLFLLKGVNRSNTASLIGSLSAEYSILKALKFRSTASVNYNTYRQNNYVPSTALIAGPPSFLGQLPAPSRNGIATQSQSQSTDVFFENLLTWDKQFNENNRLNVTAGNSWQISKSNSFSASGQGFPDDTYLNNLSSAALTLPSTGVSAQNSLLSFYMRANYALYEKYLFTFTGRSDASSKFPAKNRVGYFPSGGVAWRISQENFLKNISWIDEIKLRASAGYTGTQNIGDNLFYTLFSPVSYNGLNGMAPSQLGNDQIKWESTLQKDAGIDFAFFKSRLSGGIGYYEKSTSGILFPAVVDNTSGFTSVTANLADIRNRGLELTLSAEFIRNKKFQWSGNLNIAGNRSKVMALSNKFTDPSDQGAYRYGNTVLRIGEPVGLFYGNVFDGIISTQAEADVYKSVFYLATYGLTPYMGIGDAKYVLGEYGIPKSEIIGRAEPKYYGGYTNTFTYKNLSLSALATFSYGGDILYTADVQNQDMKTRTNRGVRILDRWTPEDPTSNRPRLLLNQASAGLPASNNIYDASFIRLKSITLSYQFTRSLIEKLKFRSASVYVSATNLFTLSNYPGADPEVSDNPYSLIGGYSDTGSYPTVKQFSFGLRFGF